MAENEGHRTHVNLRKVDGLVTSLPSDGNIVCPECANHCRLTEGQMGFCNLREAKNGEIVELYPEKAIVSWYFDSLPTNCVADWVCPCNTPASSFEGTRNNLAVFYGSCSSDCLFCQNISYRFMMKRGDPLMSPRELADAADERTACICYFGGDPSCNPWHSVETSKLLLEERDIRVCYETGGLISGKWLGKISDVVRRSEGIIKIDLKAYTPEIYHTLTGVHNDLVFRNFRKLSRMIRNSESFLVASILLIPGYIGVSEVRRLSNFIADCDPSIPTALLGFTPHHAMMDLPRTSHAHAQAAKEIALQEGLTNVRIGNLAHLSSEEYNFE